MALQSTILIYGADFSDHCRLQCFKGSSYKYAAEKPQYRESEGKTMKYIYRILWTAAAFLGGMTLVGSMSVLLRASKKKYVEV